jgi:threonine synthase
LSVLYDYDEIASRISISQLGSRVSGVWKYIELLPVKPSAEPISLGEGGTFLHNCPRLADEIGVRRLYLKDETSNPTGSFLDRGTTVAITKAKEFGFKSVAGVAQGNFGASLAAYSAKAGLHCRIDVPREIDLGKLYQIIAYGVEVRLAKNAEEVIPESSKETLRITPNGPYFLEGEKTTAYEICEQLHWQVPSRIFVPMGNGGHISMMWKAIQELKTLGFLKESGVMMSGVQAIGCSPIVDAFRAGREEIEPAEVCQTTAFDIGLKNPTHGSTAVRAINESGGTATTVTDEEMFEATKLLAKTEGIFAEPAAASTIAGLKKLVEEGEVDWDEDVVCVITGAGLKDPAAARRMIERVREIEQMIEHSEERKMMVMMGETKRHILQVLAEGELYGYGIWRALLDRFGSDMKIPSIYQHLLELRGLGLVERTRVQQVRGKPSRFYYRLTEKGRRTAEILDRLRI